MPTESTNLPEQEYSIKARAGELYVEPPRPGPIKQVKAFPVYLRETPAEPLSTSTKVILWIAAVIVFVLFLAALWRVAQRHGPKHPAQAAVPAAHIAILQPPDDYRDPHSVRVFYGA
jgi:hypothetical protein